MNAGRLTATDPRASGYLCTEPRASSVYGYTDEIGESATHDIILKGQLYKKNWFGKKYMRFFDYCD